MPTTPEQQESSTRAEIAAVIAVILAELAAVGVTRQSLQAYGLSYPALVDSIKGAMSAVSALRIRGYTQRAIDEFTDAFPTSGTLDQLVDHQVGLERQYEVAFIRKSIRRIVASLARGVRDGEDLRLVLQKALDRERRFNQIRQQAMDRRFLLSLEESWVRGQSPEGAYWVLDVSKKTHTEDCLAMAWRAWSWDVLDKIRPSNRHFQCGCRLQPISWARANGRPNATVIERRAPRVALQGD